MGSGLLGRQGGRNEDEESEVWVKEQSALGYEEKEVKTRKVDALDARVSSRYRELRQAVMRSVLLWYRDVLLLVCGGDSQLVFHRDAFEALSRTAAGTSYRDALARVKLVEDMDEKLSRNMPEILVFTDGFMR